MIRKKLCNPDRNNPRFKLTMKPLVFKADRVNNFNKEAARFVIQQKFSGYLKFFLSTLVLVSIILTGCTASMRKDAAKIAQAGGVLSRQMAEYYESLQKDTVDTYELNAFREAYLLQRAYDKAVEQAKKEDKPLPKPPSIAFSELDKQILAEYQKTYQALAARKKLARTMQAAYESYARLADYDATKEVSDSLDGLFEAVNGAAAFLLPDPTGLVTNLAEGILKDIARELETIKQNKKMLRESNRLVSILLRLKQVFDAERILYGGDTEVTDSTGKRRKISGISGRNAAAYRNVAQMLVESDAVISTSLVNRVLGKYDLRFPDPQVPFTQPALKAGIIKIIESRAYPLAQLSEDVGASISKGLGALVTLHNQLTDKKPLSLQAIIENSATAEVLLDQLKKKDIDPDLLIGLLKLTEGEKK